LIAVMEEVRRFDPTLASRPQLVAASKRDLLVAPDPLARLEQEAGRMGLEVLPLSAVRGDGLAELKRRLLAMLEAPAGERCA
jgi:GTP-binding protein